ncbi:MAG: hypothetical protein ACREJ2_13020 [Planctomycetota bacterium]
MIAQPLTAGNLPVEIPPDPNALQRAQRETRRVIDMSRGVLMMAVGAWSLLWGLVLLLSRLPIQEDFAVYGWMGGIAVVMVLTERWVASARQRAGSPTVSRRKRARFSPRRLVFLGLIMAVGFVVGQLSVMTQDLQTSHGLEPALLVLFLALVEITLIYRALALKLWEHGLQAVIFAFGFTLVWMHGDALQIMWLCLTIGLAHVTAGWSLHRRWRRWVAAQPPEIASAEQALDAEDLP